MKAKNILLLALAVVLVLAFAGCEKDEIIEPQGIPISDFRNIRVVDLQVTDDTDLDGEVDMAGALRVDADPATATPLIEGRRQSVGDLLRLLGGTTTPTVVVAVGQSGVEVNMPIDLNANIDMDTNPATAVPALDVRRQSVGDLVQLIGGTTTPTVVAVIRQAEVEFNRDLDQNARVHINPAETPVATSTPDLVVKASNATNNVFQIENSSATPVAFWNYLGAGYLAGNHTLAGTFTVGASATTGKDVTFYSETSGDYLLWDASEEGLIIIGTNTQTALDVQDGNVVIADTLDVNGTVDADVSTFAADSSGGISLDAATASNFNAVAGDLSLEAETGSLVLKGDEAVADAVYLDANDAAGTGVSVAVGATGGFNVDGGLTNLGSGACYKADGDNDLCVAADIEARNDLQVTADLTAGTATITGTLAANGGIAVDTSNFTVNGTTGAVSTASTLAVGSTASFAGDVTLTTPAAGNNAGAKVEMIGLPRIKLHAVGTGTNPASQTIAVFDESPMGEVAEVDGGTNLVITADTSYFRTALSTNSVKAAFTDTVDNEGWDATISESNLTDMESLAFWIYSDVALSSGDFDVTLDDTNGTDQVYSVGAVVANTWTYIELNIGACDANCDTVNGVHFLATTQGGTALGAANIYVDGMWIWDADDEDGLGVALVQDGILGVVDAADGTVLLEYTNFLVHYENGNDFLVWITNEAAAYPLILMAYE